MEVLLAVIAFIICKDASLFRRGGVAHPISGSQDVIVTGPPPDHLAMSTTSTRIPSGWIVRSRSRNRLSTKLKVRGKLIT
jgi:hypothetical protein